MYMCFKIPSIHLLSENRHTSDVVYIVYTTQVVCHTTCHRSSGVRVRDGLQVYLYESIDWLNHETFGDLTDCSAIRMALEICRNSHTFMYSLSLPTISP
jgi:hypothetical protein